MAQWFQSVVTGVTMGSIYALIALGFVSIYRTSRIINMAQGSFLMLGAFITFSFLRDVGLPFWLAAIIGIIIVVGIALALYVLVLKPILQVSLVAMILATVALSILFENGSLIIWGGFGISLPVFTEGGPLFLGGVVIARQSLWIIGLMVVVLIGLHLLNTRTRTGRQMTATAENPQAASLAGISTNRMVVLAFVISATIGALGGISLGSVVPIWYLSGSVFMLNGFIAAILGGWGSSTGAVIGGLALGVIQSVISGVLPAGYQDAIAFALLIAILYFRPRGLLGSTMTEGEA